MGQTGKKKKKRAIITAEYKEIVEKGGLGTQEERASRSGARRDPALTGFQPSSVSHHLGVGKSWAQLAWGEIVGLSLVQGKKRGQRAEE